MITIYSSQFFIHRQVIRYLQDHYLCFLLSEHGIIKLCTCGEEVKTKLLQNRDRLFFLLFFFKDINKDLLSDKGCMVTSNLTSIRKLRLDKKPKLKTIKVI